MSSPTHNTKIAEIKHRALNDFASFIRLVHPNRVLAAVHEDVTWWMTYPEKKSHQLLLLPRDHMKSTLAAYYVAWRLTRNPALRVLYISSTANLAVKQLKFIKDILTCSQYRLYWPEMVHVDEGKREKWTESEISVDHPRRKQELIRDPSVFTAGLTTSIVGLHCDLAVLDDVVVEDNSNSQEGRRKVRQQVSYLASIAGADSEQLVVGTRYFPNDLYNDLINMSFDKYNDKGEVIDTELLYEVFERKVESRGDGTGEFLWPRQKTPDGRWFGFTPEILSKKRAQYSSRAAFLAQYYNDPNDPDSNVISYDSFQHYDKNLLSYNGHDWFFKDRKLTVVAAIDFAFSVGKDADFTSIVVVGMDIDNNVFVIDIERFKTDRINEYFDRILRVHRKWKFRKLSAEVTAGQSVIVKSLREQYIRPNGLLVQIIESRPTRNKEERIEATLQPRYHNKQVFHYKGGNCSLLEEELVNRRPPHDDIKDALTSAVEILTPPLSNNQRSVRHGTTRAATDSLNGGRGIINSRFGGVG